MKISNMCNWNLPGVLMLGAWSGSSAAVTCPKGPTSRKVCTWFLYHRRVRPSFVTSTKCVLIVPLKTGRFFQTSSTPRSSHSLTISSGDISRTPMFVPLPSELWRTCQHYWRCFDATWPYDVPFFLPCHQGHHSDLSHVRLLWNSTGGSFCWISAAISRGRRTWTYS